MTNHGGLCYCVECLGTDLDRSPGYTRTLREQIKSIPGLVSKMEADRLAGKTLWITPYMAAQLDADSQADDCHIVEPK